MPSKEQMLNSFVQQGICYKAQPESSEEKIGNEGLYFKKKNQGKPF